MVLKSIHPLWVQVMTHCVDNCSTIDFIEYSLELSCISVILLNHSHRQILTYHKMISVNKPTVNITNTERNGLHATKWISEWEECEAVCTENKEYLRKDLFISLDHIPSWPVVYEE